jgi:glycosyltransferase involved in cell wall biosynthesis
MVRSADGVLTISSAGEILEKRYRLYCNNVEVLYNVPSIQTKIERRKLNRLRKRYHDLSVISFVGLLDKNKGLLTLLNVMELLNQELNNIKLLLIGRFLGKKQQEEFLDMAREKGVYELIEFLGWLPYEEMLHYLAETKVGIALFQEGYASTFLGKGTARKIFTYMHAGIPIVSTCSTEVAQVVKEENCGILVDSSSAHELAEAIKRLLTDEILARNLGENGQRAILTRYNWEDEERKLLNLYDKVIAHFRDRTMDSNV